MRRNRKIPKKMSVVATNTMRFGAIIVFFFIMVILNLLSSSSCAQLLKTKGTLERELSKLEDALTRESSRWEGMKTPERIEAALVSRGLSMHLPKPEQTVQMRANGTPYAGQLSITRVQQRGVMTPSRAQYRRKRSR